MKQLICEMCGGTDLMKQDGAFVCQNCGMKYSVEEAKKMMIEGTVEIQGTVRVDSSEELEKLYKAARNARETSNYDTATKHYQTISEKDPNSWEALLYLATLQTKVVKNGEITLVAYSVLNCISTVIALIKENIKDEDKTKEAIKEVSDEITLTSISLFYAATSFYKSIVMISGVNQLTESKERCLTIVKSLERLGNEIESNYNMTDEFYKNLALEAWKCIFTLSEYYKKTIGTYTLEDNYINSINNKIKKYDTSFVAPEKKGCYVATAVYGSYDCPQVWTLRRYRDYTLAETWYGRVFIRTYYAISPTLVKWFGDTKWFKKMWQGKLDRMVSKLNSNGVEDSPYEDKEW